MPSDYGSNLTFYYEYLFSCMSSHIAMADDEVYYWVTKTEKMNAVYLKMLYHITIFK